MLVRILFISLALILAGCASTPSKGPTDEKPGVVVQQTEDSAAKSAERLKIKVPAIAPPQAETPIGKLVEEMPAAQIKKPVQESEKVAVTVEKKPNTLITAANGTPVSDVVLNFDNADIYEVLNVFSEILGFNYMVDPRVKGTVTIRTTGKINRQQLTAVFHNILELNGVAAIEKNGFYLIVPMSEMGRMGELSSARGLKMFPSFYGKAVITVVPLKYVAAADLARVIKPFLSEGGIVYEYPAQNTLLLADTVENMRRVTDIINTLDINTFDRVHFKLFSLNNASVEDVGQEIKETFDGTQLQQVLGANTVFHFTPVPRINSILVVSSVPELFDKVEGLLKKLDSAASENVVKVFVYRVQNGKAEDIVSVLQEIYDTSGESKEKTKKGEASSQQAIKNLPQNRAGQQAQPTPTPTGGTSGGTETITGEVKIVFDEVNNSILVRATPRDYRSVLSTIKSLDVYPRQVLIEVLIAEISLTDELSLGFEWQKLGILGANSVLGVDLTTDSGSQLPATGFVWTIDYPASFISALRALASDNKLDILASPHIIASNNTEAKIDISQEVPILTTQTTTTTTTTTGVPQTIDRTIQYRDTGIILTVTPHINDQGLVKLDVNQEVSNVDTAAQVQGIDSPVFSKRVATTTLTVQDGQPIIIGGLIRTDKSRGRGGVPVLSSLPLIGWVFGYYQDTTEKRELMLMLTPRVIEQIEEADLVTAEFKRKIYRVQQEVENSQKLR